MRKTCRVALSDANNDGWDDLWQSLFPHIDLTKPNLDEDQDGRSNYEEMLGFSDPSQNGQVQVEVTEAILKQAQERAADTKQPSDSEKRLRFKQVLISRGVVKESSLESDEKRDESLDGAPRNVESIRVIPPNLGEPRPPIPPKIIALERLANGQVLLAWEGEADRLYDVMYSDDLVEWKPGGCGPESEPLYNGVGTFGQTTTLPARFFRVEANDVSDYFSIEGPDGENGEAHKDGGPNSIRMKLTVTGMKVEATVDINKYHKPSNIHIYVDVEAYSTLSTSGEGYVGYLNPLFITRGQHLVHASFNSSYFIGESWGKPGFGEDIIVRSQEVSFSNDTPGLSGIRTTERHICEDSPGAPQSTTFFVEYPSLLKGDDEALPDLAYRFTMKDEDGNPVRVERGNAPSAGPGQVSFTWDGEGDNGVHLPIGPYDLDFCFENHKHLSIKEALFVKVGPY